MGAEGCQSHARPAVHRRPPGPRRPRAAADRGPLLFAAALTIPAIVIEQSDVAQPWDGLALALNWVIWTAFLLEVVVMLHVSPRRGRWLRDHPLEIAIVLFTAPFWPAVLQAARLFRLLSLLRLVKLAMLSRRLLSSEGVRDAAIFALLTVLGGGVAFAAVEGRGLTAWDGVWWAITTVTTVGYGDTFPETDAGRAIGVVVMLVGIGFVAVLTGSAAERFTRGRATEALAEAEAQTAAAAQPSDAEIRERIAAVRRELDALERALG